MSSSTETAAPSTPLILVTGATDGIGKETAFQLARLGARVIVHGRSEAGARATAADIRTRAGVPWVGHAAADFASFSEVRAMAAQLATAYPTLDVLINNAGAYIRRRTVTPDGLEATLQINHLSPFLLTHLLLPLLEGSGHGRIVNVASVAHLRAKPEWINQPDPTGELYDDYEAYAASKLAMVFCTIELARRLGKRPVTVNALHPGVVSTKLLLEGFGTHGPDSLLAGSATSVYLAMAPDAAGITGRYFVDRRPSRMHALAGDPATTGRAYALSAKLVGLAGLPR